MTDRRPDPDALLKRVDAASEAGVRGRLKIFIGMCAGVGKTYAMLQEAQERRRSGVDVVVGYVETHQRAETDALRAALEELPPRWIEYRGVRLRDFDLDAALARRPALVLVDELAHTNAPAGRHAKRFQDVLELVEAGIDVYTTVNVQHIESLNDVVAGITGVVVAETVPDSVLERADEIELVDIPPDDLLERLRAGKVYIAEQARRASERFFRRENLVALRELALRETAARVAAQVRTERAVRGDVRPWATAERILVAVGPSPLSARVVRVAKRMVAAQQADWSAVSVDRPGQPERARAQMRRNLKLAERLGADVAVLAGSDVVAELLAYAERHNFNKIVIGKPTLPRWREWLRGSVIDDLIRRSGEIDVHVVKGEAEAPDHPAPRAQPTPIRWRPYLAAVGVVLACTLLAAAAFPVFSAVNLTMIYLVGVVFVATRYPAGPAALASVLGALLFNFCFTEPYYTFSIQDGELVVAFVALLLTALVISGLAQRVRQQNAAARTRYMRTAALYFMSRQLAATADDEDLARISAKHVADVFQGAAAVLRPRTGRLGVAGATPDFRADDPKEQAAAQWVFEHAQWAGWSTETLAASRGIYVPLQASGRPLGVLAFQPRDRAVMLEPDQRHLLETFATQLAIALERAALAASAEDARREVETEQLRSSLLSTVSHDFRTPLAAIGGSASVLADPAAALDEPARRVLAHAIADEAQRLGDLVSKLLEMTRLEAAGFKLQRELYPLDDLVGAALTRLGPVLRDHSVRTDLAPRLPLVFVDGPLIEQVLTNLLENAARYAPAASLIIIRAIRADERFVRVDVLDEGPGLEPGTEQAVFRRFVRQRPTGERSGTGLGLAICEAVIRLHAGEIGAENRATGGTRFWFTIPIAERAAVLAFSPAQELSAPTQAEATS